MSVRYGTALELHGVGFTSNISSRGLGVVAQTVHPAGTRLRFELKLSNAEFCRVEGVVAWSMKGISALQVPGSMGVRLDSADEAFFRFLATQSPESNEGPSGAKTVPGAPSQGVPSKQSAVTIPSAPTPSRAPPSSVPSAPPPPRADGPTVVTVPKAPPRAAESTFIAAPPPAPTSVPAAPVPAPVPTTSVPAPAAVAPVSSPPPVPLVPTAPVPVAPIPAPAPAPGAPLVSDAALLHATTDESGTATADWWQEPEADRKEVRFQGVPRVPRVPRFFEQIPIRFGVTSHLDLRGFTENISRTGMAITCPYPLTPGDTVLFALTMPDESKCHGTASVMWTRLGRSESRDQPVMGIRIKRVEKTFRDLLDALARRH